MYENDKVISSYNKSVKLEFRKIVTCFIAFNQLIGWYIAPLSLCL